MGTDGQGERGTIERCHRLVFGEKRKRDRQLRCQRGRIENAIRAQFLPHGNPRQHTRRRRVRFRDMAERSTDASEQPGAV